MLTNAHERRLRQAGKMKRFLIDLAKTFHLKSEKSAAILKKLDEAIEQMVELARGFHNAGRTSFDNAVRSKAADFVSIVREKPAGDGQVAKWFMSFLMAVENSQSAGEGHAKNDEYQKLYDEISKDLGSATLSRNCAKLRVLVREMNKLAETKEEKAAIDTALLQATREGPLAAVVGNLGHVKGHYASISRTLRLSMILDSLVGFHSQQ